MASEASHITHEVFGEIRAGGSSLARPRAYFLVSYGRDEIGFLNVWLPLWIEFDGKRMIVPIVIDEDPSCDCDCVLGSLGMLGFKLLTPQGVVVCSPTIGQAVEFVSFIKNFWNFGLWRRLTIQDRNSKI